jgi:hypothetical protein
MKTSSQGNIQHSDKNLGKVAKQAKNKVSGLYIDVSSLPKEIRKEIYNDLLK